MTWTTRCNRCSLDRMLRTAESRGVALIVDADRYFQGWTSVRYSDVPYPAAHFAALTEICCCDPNQLSGKA